MSNTCTFRKKFALFRGFASCFFMYNAKKLRKYFADINTAGTANDNEKESLSEANESVSASDSELLSSDQSEYSDSDRNELTPMQSKCPWQQQLSLVQRVPKRSFVMRRSKILLGWKTKKVKMLCCANYAENWVKAAHGG